MLRCLVRLRPPALLIACTPSGIRWAVASAWVAGYGGPLFLLGCSFEMYDAAVSGAAVLALSSDCVHAPLCIRFAVVLFSTNPWAFFFIYVFSHFIYLFSRTTQLGIVVLGSTT